MEKRNWQSVRVVLHKEKSNMGNIALKLSSGDEVDLRPEKVKGLRLRLADTSVILTYSSEQEGVSKNSLKEVLEAIAKAQDLDDICSITVITKEPGAVAARKKTINGSHITSVDEVVTI